MIGLTAWIGAMVGAMGVWFTSVMPTLLLLSLWPTLTFGVLHKLWEYMQKCFTWSKTSVDSNEYWDLYPTMRDKSNDWIDDWTEVYWDVKERTSKNWKRYYEVNWDKFFLHDSGWDYVIPRDWIPYSTDEAMSIDDDWEKVQYHENVIDDDRYFYWDDGVVKDFSEAYDKADQVWLWTHRLK